MFYECFRNKNENETGSFKLKKIILFYTHHVPYVVMLRWVRIFINLRKIFGFSHLMISFCFKMLNTSQLFISLKSLAVIHENWYPKPGIFKAKGNECDKSNDEPNIEPNCEMGNS